LANTYFVTGPFCAPVPGVIERDEFVDCANVLGNLSRLVRQEKVQSVVLGAGGSKPAALNEMADGPSAAADFCNKIGTKRTCRLYRLMSVAGGTTDLLGCGPRSEIRRRHSYASRLTALCVKHSLQS
jgi:hypothetical protein